MKDESGKSQKGIRLKTRSFPETLKELSPREVNYPDGAETNQKLDTEKAYYRP